MLYPSSTFGFCRSGKSARRSERPPSPTFSSLRRTAIHEEGSAYTMGTPQRDGQLRADWLSLDGRSLVDGSSRGARARVGGTDAT
jgi:hypothetical protein